MLTFKTYAKTNNIDGVKATVEAAAGIIGAAYGAGARTTLVATICEYPNPDDESKTKKFTLSVQLDGAHGSTERAMNALYNLPRALPDGAPRLVKVRIPELPTGGAVKLKLTNADKGVAPEVAVALLCFFSGADLPARMAEAEYDALVSAYVTVETPAPTYPANDAEVNAALAHLAQMRDTYAAANDEAGVNVVAILANVLHDEKRRAEGLAAYAALVAQPNPTETETETPAADEKAPETETPAQGKGKRGKRSAA